MRMSHWVDGVALLAVSLLATSAATAAPSLRVLVEQKGDFVLIGNTLGYECTAGTPMPVVGNVGMCGNTGLGDSAPDIFWRADSPLAGQAEANTGITVGQARSTAVLSLPPGAVATHAFLYWAGIASNADTTVTITRPGTFTQDVTAVQTYESTDDSYQSVADVTDLIAAQGSGAYRVSGVNTANVVNVNQNVNFAGWWMVVLYTLDTDPPRSLALFEGLDPISNGNNQNTLLGGFLVPPAFGAAKLGVVAFEGDNTINGDAFQFNGVTLTNGQNPDNNFFNGTRSFLGMPVSVAGDLPQLTGTAQSMGGMDIDVIDVTAQLVAGQTSAPIVATSSGDQYYLAGFVTSIPTFKPDFTSSLKSAVDLNGGSLVAGDTIEYTINVVNNGTDTSVNTALTDVIPAQLAYVPGSIQLSSGPGSGAQTDAAMDDRCEYNAPLTTITCRLGVGANTITGGQMAVGATTSVKFLATVKPGVAGTISNQATISAGGLQGAPPADAPTDGNGNASGSPPTDVVVEQCLTDADCPAATPKCDVPATPNVCVDCLANSDCPATKPTCDTQNECVCIPSGMEQCDGIDNDCNGTVDEGCVVNCTNDAQCAPDSYCEWQVCLPDKNIGQPCTGANQCQSGFCVDGVCCEDACASTCMACSAAKKGSGDDGACGLVAAGLDPNGECDEQGEASCGTDGSCDGAGACTLYADTTVCSAAECVGSVFHAIDLCDGTGTCLDGGAEDCAPFACGPEGCLTACSSDASCDSTAYCDDATCVLKLPVGAPCDTDAQCQTSFCVDAVCCANACDGKCSACSAAKKGGGPDGACAPVAPGTDPDNECLDQGAASCGTNGDCNGYGACQKYTEGCEGDGGGAGSGGDGGGDPATADEVKSFYACAAMPGAPSRSGAAALAVCLWMTIARRRRSRLTPA